MATAAEMESTCLTFIEQSADQATVMPGVSKGMLGLWHYSQPLDQKPSQVQMEILSEAKNGSIYIARLKLKKQQEDHWETL
jgi:hypothetical protein